LTDIFPARQ